jgi:hypothetical protein
MLSESFGVGAFCFAVLVIAPNKITEGLPTTIDIIHREVNGSAEESAYVVRDIGWWLCGVMRRRLRGYDLVFQTGSQSDELHPLFHADRVTEAGNRGKTGIDLVESVHIVRDASREAEKTRRDVMVTPVIFALALQWHWEQTQDDERSKDYRIYIRSHIR